MLPLAALPLMPPLLLCVVPSERVGFCGVKRSAFVRTAAANDADGAALPVAWKPPTSRSRVVTWS